MELPLTVAAITLAAGAAAAWLRHTQQQMDARARQVRRSRELLATHLAAVTEFVDAEKAPDQLKIMLLDMSDALDSEEVTSAFASYVEAGEKSPAALSEDTNAALAFLEQNSPELWATYLRAVVCGALGAMLRFSSSAQVFERVAMDAAESPRKVVARAAFAASQRHVAGAAAPA